MSELNARYYLRNEIADLIEIEGDNSDTIQALRNLDALLADFVKLTSDETPWFEVAKQVIPLLKRAKALGYSNDA